ncbi:helix-turn-helix domain-containing protein [Arthrobacter ramosus]|uniref:Helix-turn-helix transcriptional regulator n=1 Tax=Arthrobacter ramosus TaxID=1672 RepID=A0ABV5Y291_ARTRM|nr:helix-turn-helix transcriptional regulator [Arthrobacter ramosus]
METSNVFPVGDATFQAVYAEEAAMVDASELIALAMEKAQVGRSDLARLLRVPRSEITARLSGDRNITVRNLAKTLHVLGARLALDIEVEEPVTTPSRGQLIRDAYINSGGPRTRHVHETHQNVDRIKDLVRPRP